METIKETMVCKCCGRELPIDQFRVTHLGRRQTCDECISKKSSETKAKKREANENAQKAQDARALRLQDFSPRELMKELKRRGYDGELQYVEVHTIDLATIDD